MKEWIVPLSADHSASLVGRKAAALGKLISAGFPVVPGVCITTGAYRAAAAGPAQLARLPAGLLKALAQALPVDAPLAVRSSAVLEDLPESSMAGHYDTYLNVRGAAAIERAIINCWRSYAVAPSAKGGNGIAILIQPLIDAECSGVCFSVDPVRLRPDLLLVTAGWGLGTGVVNGSVPSDTARLRRVDLSIESITTADKHTAQRAAPSSAGVAPVAVPQALRDIACLPEEWLQRIGQYALTIEQVFGAPQDIEWAVAENKIWILQSRPITALPVETREAVRFPVAWDNDEEPRHYWWLTESGSHPGSAMMPAEIDQFKRTFKGGEDAVYFGGYAGTRWRKYAHGRAYMAGASSSNAPGHVRVYSAARQDLMERMARENITHWDYWGPEIALATARLDAFNAREADGPALAAHLEDTMAAATRHWMVHTLTPRMIRSAALLDAYTRLTGKPPEVAAADIPFLLSGAETIQTRLVESLYDLACLALDAPAAARQAALAREPGAPPDDQTMEPFAAAWDRLMAIYGGRLCHRPVPGYTVDLPLPWREAPQHVWEMVSAYLPLARRGGPVPRETRAKALAEAETRVEALCAGAAVEPALVEAFRRELAYARRNAAFLDEHNHHIDQLSWGQYMQALLHAGRWLVAQGCLDSVYEIYWFTTGEILSALYGEESQPAARLRETAAARRAEFDNWLTRIPPACLGLPDPNLPARAEADQTPASAAPGQSGQPAHSITGEPASRGRAEGRARVVAGDVDAALANATSGEVLVAAYVSLAWTAALPALSALVLDYSGPGDHAAITAREFGLPMVCATLYATQRIPDGAWVTVDADSGLVSWKDLS